MVKFTNQEEVNSELGYKELPKPSDIVNFIKAYYNLLSDKNQDSVVKVSRETVEYLEDLIKKYHGKSPEGLYLVLYNQIAVDTAKSKCKIEQKYDERIQKLKKTEDSIMSEIKNKVKGVKRGVERWFSIGVGSLFSYFASNFLVEYLSIPNEYVQDAVAAMTFGLIGLISVGVHKYYSHESVKLLYNFNKKVDSLESERTHKTKNLYRRGELLAKIDYMVHIEGIPTIKKVVDKVSKEDGTQESALRRLYNSLVHLVKD